MVQLIGTVTTQELNAVLNEVIEMATPAGNDKEIQYNNSGSFGASDKLLLGIMIMIL